MVKLSTRNLRISQITTLNFDFKTIIEKNDIKKNSSSKRSEYILPRAFPPEINSPSVNDLKIININYIKNRRKHMAKNDKFISRDDLISWDLKQLTFIFIKL